MFTLFWAVWMSIDRHSYAVPNSQQTSTASHAVLECKWHGDLVCRYMLWFHVGVDGSPCCPSEGHVTRCWLHRHGWQKKQHWLHSYCKDWIILSRLAGLWQATEIVHWLSCSVQVRWLHIAPPYHRAQTYRSEREYETSSFMHHRRLRHNTLLWYHERYPSIFIRWYHM